MPFNEKGEFIRSPKPHLPNPATVRHSKDQRTRLSNRATTNPIHDVLIVMGSLAGLAALIGVIWAVVMFWNWVVLVLVIWIISSLRERFF